MWVATVRRGRGAHAHRCLVPITWNYETAFLNPGLVSMAVKTLCVYACVGNVLEVVISGLEPEAQYQLQVAAYTRKGDGERSRPKKIRTKGAGTSNWAKTKQVICSGRCNKTIVDSRLRPQWCLHLANIIEMEEMLDCKLDAHGSIWVTSFAGRGTTQNCPYHVTFDLDLDIEHTLDAGLSRDHRVQVWSRSGHLPAIRNSQYDMLAAGMIFGSGQTDYNTSLPLAGEVIIHTKCACPQLS